MYLPPPPVFADLHIYAICGSAIVSTWLQRVCHVVTTCLPLGKWKQLHFRKLRICKSANPRCACVHVRKSRMCTSVNPRCVCVHVRKSHMCKSANPRCACVHVRKSQMCTSLQPRPTGPPYHTVHRGTGYVSTLRVPASKHASVETAVGKFKTSCCRRRNGS